MALVLSPRSGKPRKGGKPLYGELGEDLALDLAAFCKANYNAPQIVIIREALTEHIEQRLKDPGLRSRFVRAKSELRAQMVEPLRLIDKGEKQPPQNSPDAEQ